MTFSFHPEAESEFAAAQDFYDEREFGLGKDFLNEVHETIGLSEVSRLVAAGVTSYTPMPVQSLPLFGNLPAHRNRANDLRRRSPKTKALVLEEASKIRTDRRLGYAKILVQRHQSRRGQVQRRPDHEECEWLGLTRGYTR